MPAQRSLYDILNVAPGAEPVVIEAAYRALMKKYHPDQAEPASAGPSAAEINRAFSVLRDPERRSEYDRREWTRRQDIQLAPYKPAPPAGSRGMRVFGWGGWVVALILGGVIAAMAGRLDQAADARAAAARAAAAAAGAEPDLRSQPSAPDSSLVPAATLAEIRAEALAAPPRAPARAAKAAAARSSQAKPRRGSPARSRKTAEEDFLEREGYIY